MSVGVLRSRTPAPSRTVPATLPPERERVFVERAARMDDLERRLASSRGGERFLERVRKAGRP